MEGTVDVTYGTVKIMPRLVDARTDRKIWVGTFIDSLDNVAAMPRQIAAEAAAAIVRFR